MVSYQSYDDTHLLMLMKDGCEPAFTAIYNRYWEKLFYIAGKKLDSLPDVENLVQEVFMDIWVRRSTLEIHKDLEGYLVVATKYKIINILARRDRERQYHNHLGGALVDNEVDRWIAFDELRSWLERYVQQLPEKCQLVFRLREAGYTQKQIAQRLSISEKTVENHVGHALKILKSNLSHFLPLYFLYLFFRFFS